MSVDVFFPLLNCSQQILQEVEGGLVHVEDPLQVTMWTNEERISRQISLRNSFALLLISVGEQVASLVEKTDGLQLGIEGLGAKYHMYHGGRLEGDQHVSISDALVDPLSSYHEQTVVPQAHRIRQTTNNVDWELTEHPYMC